MKIFDVEVPTWFEDQLYQISYKPDLNLVFRFLLEDYLKRHEPANQD